MRTDRGLAARERWGYPAFTKMVSDLPADIALEGGSVEGRCWREGRHAWITDLLASSFVGVRHDRTRALGARAAFLAPIRDEQGRTLSLLLFLGPIAFQGDVFLGQAAETLVAYPVAVPATQGRRASTVARVDARRTDRPAQPSFSAAAAL